MNVKQILMTLSAGLATACTTTNLDTQKTSEEAGQNRDAISTSTSQEEIVIPAIKRSICQETFNAVGSLEGRPNLYKMWNNYLDLPATEVFNHVGGYVRLNGNLPHGQGRWENACAVRMSYMLNKLDPAHKVHKYGSKTVSGALGDQYYFRVRDYRDYLKRRYGAPDIELKKGETGLVTLPNVPGLLVLDYNVPGNSFDGHITLWNGHKTVDDTFDTSGHTESGVHLSQMGVAFYKLPCVEPSSPEITIRYRR